MMPCGKEVDDDSNGDEPRSEPKGKTVRSRGTLVLHNFELLKEKSEPRYHKPKSHQRQPGTNPGKKCALGGKVIAQIGLLPHFYWCAHLLSLLSRQYAPARTNPTPRISTETAKTTAPR